MKCLQEWPLPSRFYQNAPTHPQDRIGGFRNKSVLWRRYYRVIFFAILFLKHNSHMAQYFPKIYRESSILFKKNRFNDPILGPPQLGGCLKRGGVQSFCPIKSTFIHFSRFFFTDCWEIFVLSGGVGVYSMEPQKSKILVLNREGVLYKLYGIHILRFFFTFS